MKVRLIAEKEESLCILATQCGREDVVSDPDARKLAERLDGHPLALATAGAFLSQSSISFSKYLEQYEAKWKVIESIEPLSEYPLRTLYSTWDISFAQIQQVSERAAHLLMFLAYLDHQDIRYDLLHRCRLANQPAWFIELASDEFIFEEAIQTLSKYCLVESHHHQADYLQTGSYSLHVCVHDWTLDGLNSEIDRVRYGLAVDCLDGCISHIGQGNRSTLQSRWHVAHAKRLLHDRFEKAFNVSATSQRDAQKLRRIADLLNEQNHHHAAEQYYQQALAGQEKLLGPEHSSTLMTINNLGNAYKSQRKLELAEQYYQRALAGKEKVFGPEHSSTLITISNLGNVYENQGKPELAEQYYQRALAGKEKIFGPEHLLTLNTINDLGVLFERQGKPELAEQYYQRALVGYEKTSLSETIPGLRAMANLGILYGGQGKTNEAKAMCQRALSSLQKTFGPDHPLTLTTVNFMNKFELAEKPKENDTHSTYDEPKLIGKKKKGRWRNVLGLKRSKHAGSSHPNINE